MSGSNNISNVPSQRELEVSELCLLNSTAMLFYAMQVYSTEAFFKSVILPKHRQLWCWHFQIHNFNKLSLGCEIAGLVWIAGFVSHTCLRFTKWVWSKQRWIKFCDNTFCKTLKYCTPTLHHIKYYIQTRVPASWFYATEQYQQNQRACVGQ